MHRINRCWTVAVVIFVSVVPSLRSQTPEAEAKRYLEELRRSSGTPGLSVAVAKGGGIVFSKGVGFADLDNMVPATPLTVYNIGSVSKDLAAVAIMQLVEQGKVNLTDPIQKFVPAFPEKRSPITIFHIMTHTSGIRHYRANDFRYGSENNDNVGNYASLNEAIEIFKNDTLLFDPGEYYLYSSYAVNLLQGVVEAASGMGFEEYMRRNVWDTAGMASSQFDVPERIVPHRARGYKVRNGITTNYYPNENVTYKFAGGGMLSTAEDLARFGIGLLQGTLLKPETVKLMFTSQLENIKQVCNGNPPEALAWKQGLMWRIRQDEKGRDFVYACGTVKGFNSCMVMYVEEGLVVTSADNSEAVGFRPLLRLAQIFRTTSTQ